MDIGMSPDSYWMVLNLEGSVCFLDSGTKELEPKWNDVGRT